MATNSHVSLTEKKQKPEKTPQKKTNRKGEQKRVECIQVGKLMLRAWVLGTAKKAHMGKGPAATVPGSLSFRTVMNCNPHLILILSVSAPSFPCYSCMTRATNLPDPNKGWIRPSRPATVGRCLYFVIPLPGPLPETPLTRAWQEEKKGQKRRNTERRKSQGVERLCSSIL